MAEDVELKPGECVTSLACRYQVPVDTIWNHPRNAELKRLRKDPNVLRAGDRVHVPDRVVRPLALATGDHHKIFVKKVTAKLRVRVVIDLPPPAPEPPAGPPSADRRNVAGEDPAPEPREDKPRASLAYKLVVNGVTTEGQTDGDGFADCEIPPGAAAGLLVLAPGTPHETEVPLKLGHLDPIDTVSGVKQRLRNLCFDCGDVDDGDGDVETDDLATALRAFQAKHGLSATGALDDATRAQLVKAHGGT